MALVRAGMNSYPGWWTSWSRLASTSRCASRRGGKDFDALEVAEIYFDERFGEDVFTSREPLSWRP
jgi:hypothetical protein